MRVLILETMRNEHNGISGEVNELSHFTPNQVATKEIRMDHFEQGLQGEIKQILAGYAYTSLQEMY